MLLHLAPIDFAVVAIFIVAILTLGFSAKLRDSSVLSYIAAGRNLSLPAFVATLVSTWYGGILAIGDSVKDFGMGTLLLMGVPYYFFAIIYALFMAKKVRGADQISIPERLALRYGRGAGLAGAGLVFLLAVPAAHVLMLGTMLHLLSGWDLGISIVLATFVGTLFLYRGGLLADVRAGMLAFVMMYVGFFIIAGWCLFHIPPSTVIAKVSPELLRFDGGQNFLVILSFFILGSWTIVDPGFHQRVSSAASPNLGRTGVLVSTGFWVLCDLLTLTTGMYALVLLRPDAGGLTFFPELGDKVLPPGLKAVFLCGLIGTILSAMVGYTLVSGATFGREFIGRLRPEFGDQRIKFWTRVGIALGSAVAVALALTATDVVKDLWYNFSGAIVGALLIPVCLAYRSKKTDRLSTRWVTWALIFAFLASFSWMVQGKRTNNDSLLVKLAGQEFSLGTLVPGLLVSATVLGLGEAVGRRAIKNDR